MIKIAFSGSRKRSARLQIRNIILGYINKYGIENIVIVHGGCPKGIDAEVKEIAEELGVKQVIFYPEKQEARYYLERNKKIARYADILYAFPGSRETGEKALKGIVTRGGTEHTIRQFVKLGKPVILY